MRTRRCLKVTLLMVILLVATSSQVHAGVYNKYYCQALPISCETPKVILQPGTVGSSTIYTNNTSAKISAAAPSSDLQYNESESESTTTSTSWQDKVVLIWNVSVTADYVILATADVATSGTSASYQAEAQITVDGTAYSLHKILSGAANDYLSFFAAKKVNLASGSHTIKVQYRSANGVATAKIRNAHLLAWSQVVEYAESDVESSTASTTFQNKTILTFTPSEAANYLVIGTAVITGFGFMSGYPVEADLTIDGTEYGYSLINPVTLRGYNYYSFGVIKGISLSAASHTIIIRWRSTNGTLSAYIKDARIVALKLGTNYYNESESETSTTSTTPVDKVVNIYTPSAGNYLTLGTTQTKHSSTSNIGNANFNLSSTEYHHISFTPYDASNYFASVFMKKRTLTNTLTTDRIQYWVTAGTEYSNRTRLITLNLPSSTYDYVLKIVNQIANNWTVNLKIYNSSNIGRLSSATITFHDGSSSNQIIINGGVITQSEGSPYNLTGSGTIYIAINNLQANATGTSYLYAYLKVLRPGTSTFNLLIITFEIT